MVEKKVTTTTTATSTGDGDNKPVNVEAVWAVIQDNGLKEKLWIHRYEHYFEVEERSGGIGRKTRYSYSEADCQKAVSDINTYNSDQSKGFAPDPAVEEKKSDPAVVDKK